MNVRVAALPRFKVADIPEALRQPRSKARGGGMTPTKLFIDTEFNSFGGALISMALVDEHGKEFYEALPCRDPHPWVLQHVLPVMNRAPISPAMFRRGLARFLGQYPAVHLIADWPEDIGHFCRALISGPGERIDTPPLTLEVRRDLESTESRVPHNALADAHAIRQAYMGIQG